jgi:hypothetical protein
MDSGRYGLALRFYPNRSDCALTSKCACQLWLRRSKKPGTRHARTGESPGASYFVVMALGLMMITLTGHLGGILSGVESP